MQQANAQGVRGRRADSVLRRVMNRMTGHGGATSDGAGAGVRSGAKAGPETTLPAWPGQLNRFAMEATQSLRSEKFLRRLVPVLVVSLLLLVAFVRTMWMLSLAEDIERAARNALVQTSGLRALRLKTNAAFNEAVTGRHAGKASCDPHAAGCRGAKQGHRGPQHLSVRPRGPVDRGSDGRTCGPRRTI